ncbi:MAG: ferritin family protein [Thermoplasmata archaeon]
MVVMQMDLEKYGTREIFLSAIRSEMEAREFYRALAARVKNAYLKGRLLFLASEEEKHRRHLTRLYRQEFGRGRIPVPETSIVPMPALRVPRATEPISALIEAAMEAERATSDFYASLAKRFEPDSAQARALTYLAQMELGHHSLLESERELMAKEEWFATEWPMMHAGP